jgi:uncharacterized protein YecE (DUF72 family)
MLAVEFRDRSWFSQDTVELCRSLGVTAVSVDTPIESWVVPSNEVVYLRLQGRVEWYAYEYSEEELEGLAGAIADMNPG